MWSTSPSTFSLREVFRTYHWPIFVVEPNSDKLCWLYPEWQRRRASSRPHHYIDDYLTVFGARGEFSDGNCLPSELKFHELQERWASNALELGPGSSDTELIFCNHLS
ncbi:DUF1887 family protein [Vibrio chagasii]|nr:DUF1887 family protein [Vibrio chagasii]